MRDLGIILLNYNGSNDTIECVQSICKSITKYNFDIYIMDNNSKLYEKTILRTYFCSRTDFEICSYDEFKNGKKRGNILIFSDDNVGFAKGNNKIIKEIFNEYYYILLLNNDTIIETNFIEEMLILMNEKKYVGFGSCRINNYYRRDELWNCGGSLKIWGLREYYSENKLQKMGKIISAEFITGCALFIKSNIIERYGVLSEDFFHGEEDFNFCWRMKQRNVKGKCLNKTLVYHKINTTSDKFGLQAGKMASYYASRIIDMKKFYPNIIWHIWKEILIIILKIRWNKAGYSNDEIRKMISIIKRTSKLDGLNREETIKIWNMNY